MRRGRVSAGQGEVVVVDHVVVFESVEQTGVAQRARPHVPGFPLARIRRTEPR